MSAPDHGPELQEFYDMLAEAEKKGFRMRFWICPLHPAPRAPMETVRWDGDEATCCLCGFTRREHKTRGKLAEAASAPEGLEGLNVSRPRKIVLDDAWAPKEPVQDP